MNEIEAPPSAASRGKIGHAQLFLGFSSIGLRGFGGVLPWAHRILVEQRGWLRGEEFTELLAMCQLIPGPNIVNLSVAVGSRFAGPTGALVSFVGLMFFPVIIALSVVSIYESFAEVAEVKGAIGLASSAAAGLLVAMTIKMAGQLKQSPPLALFALAPIALIVGLDVSIAWVLLIVAPLSVTFAWASGLK